jgi:hypothetical protein
MDLNGQIAALLRDFAAVQKSKQSMWGYRRAAAAILALEKPIASLLQDDSTLLKIPNVGPSSARIIIEVLQSGTSATVERAIADGDQTSDIDRRRDPLATGRRLRARGARRGRGVSLCAR